MKQVESSQHDAPDDNVDAGVRTSSLSTFERLQEDIIELEGTQRRLQEDIIELAASQRRLQEDIIELEATQRRLHQDILELEASHRDDSRRTS